jgi:hypothetical protein
LARKAVEGYAVAAIETGLAGVMFEAAVAVRQYDLHSAQDQVVATDTVVVRVPGRHEAALEVSLVYRSRADLRAVKDQMITGKIEAVPGHYCGTELAEDTRGTAQGVPGHNKFGMVLGVD